jgi:protein-disulfide isomerase
LASNAQFDEAGIMEIAKRLGMNSDLLEKDMKDPKPNDVIVLSEQLATALNPNGTPGYIVGSQIVPGAIDLDTLEKLVATERAKLRGHPRACPSLQIDRRFESNST